MKTIARRLVLPFVGFVVAGSLALVWWLGSQERRESQELFATMARTNAEFIRSQNLPLSARTAESLAAVLRTRIQFTAGSDPWEFTVQAEDWDANRPLVSLALKQAGMVKTDGTWEAVASVISETAGAGRNDIVLLRRVPDTSYLARPRTLAVLGAFWALSIALAGVLARSIVRPLRQFAARLPQIGRESTEPLPEAEREDEIGQLARAYTETRAQLATERAAREQAERLATLGRMTTGLAHEINNPVAAIKLHAQLLEGEVQGTPPVRLEIILAEASKIESLVSQWMFLSRPQPPQTAPTQLAALVGAIIRTLEPAALHAKVNVVNATDAAAVVMADHRRLGQAVTNVLVNAIHAMAAQGGTVTVSTILESCRWALRFTDSGPGFSARALEHGQELFFSEKEGGMGIGLNVTAEIVRAHGGTLTLSNAPGGGALVTISLPATA